MKTKNSIRNYLGTRCTKEITRYYDQRGVNDPSKVSLRIQRTKKMLFMFFSPCWLHFRRYHWSMKIVPTLLLQSSSVFKVITEVSNWSIDNISQSNPGANQRQCLFVPGLIILSFPQHREQLLKFKPPIGLFTVDCQLISSFYWPKLYLALSSAAFFCRIDNLSRKASIVASSWNSMITMNPLSIRKFVRVICLINKRGSLISAKGNRNDQMSFGIWNVNTRGSPTTNSKDFLLLRKPKSS